MGEIVLKGMTWNHPRGFDPLVASSALWKETTGISIDWVQRSLQDFESYPVEELARTYDLIILDHPHIGQIARERCLIPLDMPTRDHELNALKRASVGPSFGSYGWDGRHWALPVDAAAAVQAYRPDILSSVPEHWAEVVHLAREGRVLLPLKPPHNLMVFFTLAGNLGRPCSVVEDRELIDSDTGVQVFEAMLAVANQLPTECFNMDPISVYEKLSAGRDFACAPMQMGYVSYSQTGFRKHVLKYSNVPALGSNGPIGSALGGTGLAVSAFSDHPNEAIDFAYWVASEEIQRSIYASSGGQVGHSDAWNDDEVNTSVNDFYRGTRATYDAGWIRPRHDGYMAFQQLASDRINEAIQKPDRSASLTADLNALFRASFR